MGNIDLKIYPDKADETKFVDLSHSPPSEFELERGVVYEVKFKRVRKKDLALKKISPEYHQIIREYYNYHFKALNTFENDHFFTDSAFLFGRNRVLYDLILENKKRLKDDFLIVNFRDLFFLIMDTKTSKATYYYSSILDHKYTAKYFRLAIKALLFFLAGRNSSFLLHCSALSIKDKGFLFVGKSGQGKSTIARLILDNVKSSRLVSDDMVFITPYRNDFYAYRIDEGNKTTGFKALKGRMTNKIKIDRLYLIEKSEKAQLMEMDSFQSLVEMISTHILNPPVFMSNAERIFSSVGKMIGQIKTKKLLFPKNTDFIELIT